MHFNHRTENETLYIEFTCSSLDVTLASKLRAEVEKLVLESSERKVILDLASVHFMDSSGFGSLISLLKSIGDSKKKLYLTNLSSQVEATFHILNLDKVFEIVPSHRTVS